MAFQFTQTGQELQDLIDRIYQLADEYDSSASYAVGDYCSYEGKIYRCTAATTGTFDASAWTDSIFVLDELQADISSLDTRLTTAENNITTAQGDITALNTSLANIGTVVSSGSEWTASVAANATVDMGSISLSTGKWIVFVTCRFGNVAAGTRSLSASTNGTLQAFRQQIVTGGTGYCNLEVTRLFNLSAAGSAHLVVFSSVACTVDSASITAIRIA